MWMTRNMNYKNMVLNEAIIQWENYQYITDYLISCIPLIIFLLTSSW